MCRLVVRVMCGCVQCPAPAPRVYCTRYYFRKLLLLNSIKLRLELISCKNCIKFHPPSPGIKFLMKVFNPFKINAKIIIAIIITLGGGGKLLSSLRNAASIRDLFFPPELCLNGTCFIVFV